MLELYISVGAFYVICMFYAERFFYEISPRTHKYFRYLMSCVWPLVLVYAFIVFLWIFILSKLYTKGE